MIHILLESYRTYYSQTFLIDLFLRFVGVSYGWFIAVRFGFNLSLCLMFIGLCIIAIVDE